MVTEVKIDKITYLMKKLFRNQLCRYNVPPNHRPACSLIPQQCCHPQAGHDSPRNKGTSRLTHSQGYTKHSQANTVGFIRPSRSWERINAKLVSSFTEPRKPTLELAWLLRHPHTPNTRNQSLLCYTVPQALHSLLVLFRGDGEEGQPSSSVCVVSSHQVYQVNQAPPSLVPTQSEEQPLHSGN